MKYTIFHIDMNSFFASVELIKFPQYKNKPFCVGGRNKIGVVSSANYVARSMGVHSAMPISIAKKVCPSLIVGDIHFNEYNYYSYKIYNLLKSLVKFVEIGSIDEWYIDVKDTFYETWDEAEFVSYLKQLIKSNFDLECTIGCSWNKFLAKMSTNISKPNNFILLTKENFTKHIYDLEISKMFFVGNKTAEFLNKNGIHKIKDVLNDNINEALMHRKLGISWYTIKQNVLGNGNTIVSNYIAPKSLGRSHTIVDINDFNEFQKLFKSISESLNNTLINGMLSYKNIVLKIKTKNNGILTANKKSENEKKWINENELITLFDSLINKKDYLEILNIAINISPIIENNKNIDQLNLFQNETNDDKLDTIIKSINYEMKKNIICKASDLNKFFYKPSK